MFSQNKRKGRESLHLPCQSPTPCRQMLGLRAEMAEIEKAEFEACTLCCSIFVPCKSTKKCIPCKSYFCNHCSSAELKTCIQQTCSESLSKVEDSPSLVNDKTWVENDLEVYIDLSLKTHYEVWEMLKSRFDNPAILQAYTQKFGDAGPFSPESAKSLNDKDNLKPLLDDTKSNKTLYMSFDDSKIFNDSLNKDDVTVQIESLLQELSQQKVLMNKLELDQEKIQLDFSKKVEQEMMFDMIEEQRLMIEKLENEQESAKLQIDQMSLDVCSILEKKFDGMQSKMNEFMVEVKTLVDNEDFAEDMKKQVAEFQKQRKLLAGKINCMIDKFQEERVDSSHGVATEIITSLNAYLPQVFFILMLFHTIYLLYFKMVQDGASQSVDSYLIITLIRFLSNIFVGIFLISVTYESINSMFFEDGRLAGKPVSLESEKKRFQELSNFLKKYLRYVCAVVFCYDTLNLLFPGTLASLLTLLVFLKIHSTSQF